MDLRKAMETQVILLDKVNLLLVERLEIELIPEIRANVELVRSLVQDIATLEQRLTIEDTQAILGKFDVQDAWIEALDGGITETTERLEIVENTLEIPEEQNLIESILDRLENLEYKLATPNHEDGE